MRPKNILMFQIVATLMTVSFGTSAVFAKNNQNSAIIKILSKPSLFKKVCGADAGYNVSKKAHFVARLNRRATLYEMNCFVAAYNQGSVYFVVKGSRSRKPILQHFYQYSVKGKRSRVAELVNPYYDKKTKTLSSYHKYMGAGLCGHAGAYKWIGTGFKLKKFVLQDSCNPGKPSDKWPVVYPKKR